MDFFLFLLVNAALFIRPAELIPATAGWPVYNCIIVINLIVAAPAIANHLARHGLTRCPTTTCVLGIWAFVVISHLARFDFWYARYNGLDFAKVVAYFLLLMATVTTPRRLLILLGSVAVFTLIINTLAVLQYYSYIHLPALEVIKEGYYDPLTGEAYLIPRMVGTGIFNDPNDLSMIIVASMVICAAGLLSKQLGAGRWLLAGPIGFLGFCLTLTQSRGGLLALLAGCGAFLYTRFGMLRAGVLAAAAFPVILAGFGGRQVDIGNAIVGGTGRHRAELWSAGIVAFKSTPLFGIGHERYVEEMGQVAHNSFVHAFVELGFFGGMLFLGLFGVVGWSLWQMRTARWQIRDPRLRHLLPYVIALMAAFAMSMMSLSRNYVVPTYLVAGIGAVYERMARPQTGLPPMTFNAKTVAALGVASVGFIALVYFFIKFMYR